MIRVHEFDPSDPRARLTMDDGRKYRAASIECDRENGLSVELVRLRVDGRDYSERRYHRTLRLTLAGGLERFEYGHELAAYVRHITNTHPDVIANIAAVLTRQAKS